MMQGMMGSGMTWSMGILGLFLVIAVLLIIAALIKYIFYR